LIGDRPEQSLWYIFGEPVGGRDMTGKGPFEQMITNTGLILRDQTGRDGLKDFSYILDDDGHLRQLIPLVPEEDHDKDRIWCMNGVLVGERLYLFWMKVLMHDKGGEPFPVGFEVVGTGLASGSQEDWTFDRLSHGGETLWWPAGQPQFAAAIHFDRDADWIYLYGSLQDTMLVHHAHLARVKPADIEDLGRYEYFSGDPEHWSGNVKDSVPLFSKMPNEMSVSWNPFLGQYLAVHSLGLTGDVVGRTAPAPWGPWSEAVTLWSVPEPEIPPPYPRLVYAGKEHPELAEENGRILYITYIEFEEYFPHLIEVTLDPNR
jgi:hypothetical protein